MQGPDSLEMDKLGARLGGLRTGVIWAEDRGGGSMTSTSTASIGNPKYELKMSPSKRRIIPHS